jgi:hypothetical protein
MLEVSLDSTHGDMYGMLALAMIVLIISSNLLIRLLPNEDGFLTSKSDTGCRTSK